MSAVAFVLLERPEKFESDQFVVKPVETIRVQNQINIFSESRIAICHQGHRSDYQIVDVVFLQVRDQPRQSVVELSFAHEIALTLSI